MKGGGPLRKAATPLLMLVRLTGVMLLVLGVLFWSGAARSLVSLHIVIGLIFVLALIALAVAALVASSPKARGLPVVTVVWAVVVNVLGFAQTDLAPGAAHWVVQVLHLLVGLVAIGLGEALGGRIRRA